MLPMKRVPVMAVVVNKENEACGFSKPLTPEQLGSKEPFTVYMDRDVDVRDIRLEFAVPGGVIQTARDVHFGKWITCLYAGSELHITMRD